MTCSSVSTGNNSFDPRVEKDLLEPKRAYRKGVGGRKQRETDPAEIAQEEPEVEASDEPVQITAAEHAGSAPELEVYRQVSNNLDALNIPHERDEAEQCDPPAEPALAVVEADDRSRSEKFEAALRHNRAIRSSAFTT